MEFNIKINEQDAQIIIQALGELPIKVAVNTFMKISSQISAQQKDKEVL